MTEYCRKTAIAMVVLLCTVTACIAPGLSSTSKAYPSPDPDKEGEMADGCYCHESYGNGTVIEIGEPAQLVAGDTARFMLKVSGGPGEFDYPPGGIDGCFGFVARVLDTSGLNNTGIVPEPWHHDSPSQDGDFTFKATFGESGDYILRVFGLSADGNGTEKGDVWFMAESAVHVDESRVPISLWIFGIACIAACIGLVSLAFLASRKTMTAAGDREEEVPAKQEAESDGA